MADDNVIEISIVLDDGSVQKGFARIKQKGDETASGLTASFKRIGETAGGVFIGQKLSEAFDFIKDKAKELFTEAIKQSSEAEQKIQSLNIALGVAGRYSEAASEQFQKFADRMQETTKLSDDEVLGLERLAITFTKTNKAALELTETAINLAAATGKDVNSALQELAGTLSGSAGRLQKLFPDLQQFTKHQLEAGAAVEYFNNRFKGAAAAEVNTFAGRLTQLRHAFDDILKTLGKSFTGSSAIVTTIREITNLVKGFGDQLKTSLQGKDIFKDMIINFSVVAQAGTETARRIGLSFELAFARIKAAYQGLRVIFTLGMAKWSNTQLDETLKEIDKIKAAFEQDSSITQWFDALILKLQMSSNLAKKTKTDFNGLGSETDDTIGKITSLGQAFKESFKGASDAMDDLNNHGLKTLRELGGTTIKALAQGVANGMSAIGKALVKGGDLFKAFAGAMVSAFGQALIQMGSSYILLGIARLFASYGADGTGYQLIGVGSAMAVAGGALLAITEGGASGASSSDYSGGGGAAPSIAQNQQTGPERLRDNQSTVTVNIQGDVLDSKESGLRIVELINDAFKDQGARVIAT